MNWRNLEPTSSPEWKCVMFIRISNFWSCSYLQLIFSVRHQISQHELDSGWRTRALILCYGYPIFYNLAVFHLYSQNKTDEKQVKLLAGHTDKLSDVFTELSFAYNKLLPVCIVSSIWLLADRRFSASPKWFCTGSSLGFFSARSVWSDMVSLEQRETFYNYCTMFPAT